VCIYREYRDLVAKENLACKVLAIASVMVPMSGQVKQTRLLEGVTVAH